MDEKKPMDEKRKPWIPDPAQWAGTWRDDWRIMGQEGYLLNKKLCHIIFDRRLVREDFDHCEFCWTVFDKNENHPLTAFYEPTGQYWICEDCFRDFSVYFGWTIDNLGNNSPK